jgi:hypothetical protein
MSLLKRMEKTDAVNKSFRRSREGVNDQRHNLNRLNEEKKLLFKN